MVVDIMEFLGGLPSGAHLSRKPNETGGHTYYSDECGCMSVVWDTCITHESTLLTAIVCEHQRKYREHMEKDGWKPTKAMQIERLAATGASFIPNTNLDDVKKSLDGE